ncbi:hypothetical protein MP228_001307 [Amoeboaphelidium protococcarum]|nr:hypothetical protein MP228_001307 [Amoeboaphelidium protococcarum]
MKFTYVIIPVTAICWYFGYRLYLDAIQDLNNRWNDSINLNSSSTSDLHLSTPIVIQQANQEYQQSDNDPLHFVHISDLHISRFSKKNAENLEHFLNSTLPGIRPAFVVVTGDLTDAKDKRKLSSLQHLEEWQMYRELLRKYEIKDDFWFDLPGNHDVFNVYGWDSANNFYKEYSMQRKNGYSFVYLTPHAKYLFLAVNACPARGPSRPFNFFGYLDTADMDKIYHAVSQDKYSHVFLLSHYPFATILTGTTSNGLTFQDLAVNISVILNGHLHKLVAGLGDVMHAKFDTHQVQDQVNSGQNSNDSGDKSSVLELEIGDMKQNGMFRVISIDKGMISFVDRSILSQDCIQSMKQMPWDGLLSSNTVKKSSGGRYASNPVVLITSPKDVRYVIDGKEDYNQLFTQDSFDIRFFVFNCVQYSTNDIAVSIDGKQLVGAVHMIKRDFYSIQCPSEGYLDGRIHTIKVQVEHSGTNSNSGSHEIEFMFPYDRNKVAVQSGFGGYILHLNLSNRVPVLFLMAYLLAFVVLILVPKMYYAYLHRTKSYYSWRVRYSRMLVQMDKSIPHPLPHRSFYTQRSAVYVYFWLLTIYKDFQYFAYASVYRLVTLASIRETYYPLLTYLLYIVVGPYFIGELVPSALDTSQSPFHSRSKFAWFYVYGIWIENKWVPITDTWMYGLLELVYLFCPLVIYLSFCITPPEQLYAPQPLEEEVKAAGQDVYWLPPIHNRRRFPLHRRLYIRILVVLVIWYQFNSAFFISIFYGPIAMLVSPGKSWFICWACYALYKHRWSFKGREVDLLEDANTDSSSIVSKLTHGLQKLPDKLRMSSKSLLGHIASDSDSLSLQKEPTKLQSDKPAVYDLRQRKQ